MKYIPITPSAVQREKRHKQIIKMYKEMKELEPNAKFTSICLYIANKFGYSLTGIRKIVKKYNQQDQ